MGWVYEVAVKGTYLGQPYANIFHVWDGDQNETPDDIADVFENNYLPDIAVQQNNQLTYSLIAVKALDAANGADPVNRTVSITGSAAGEKMNTGAHCWVKFLSDDNGFKAGGKLIGGLTETQLDTGEFTTGFISALQVIFNALITDLQTASLALAIYRPSLSTPGFPQISISSTALVRGIGTNNRRQAPFQN